MDDNVRIGDLLVQQGVITRDQLIRALDEQAKVPGVKLGAVLVQLGFCSQRDVLTAISRQLGFEVGLSRKKIR